MTLRLTLGLLCLTALPLSAQEAEPIDSVALWTEDHTIVFDGADVNLDDFVWLARPIVVFADTPADPRFQQQLADLVGDLEAMAERDVVVITDTNPRGNSPVRAALRPRGFMLAIVGKDGTVLVRRPLPWDIREISRNIDKLPLRQQEIRDRRASSAD